MAVTPIRAMKFAPTLTATFAGTALLLLPALAQDAPEPADHHDHDHAATAAAEQPTLVAVLSATAGNEVTGWIKFEPQSEGTVKLTWDVSGLQPDSEHAFHVHEFGDLSAADGSAAGGHFNPLGHDHGLPDQEHRHAGDFGNLKADASGHSQGELVVDNIQLTEGDSAIIGRGLIIHAKPDDGGQPTGNAGDRIAQAVIGVARASQPE